MLQRRILIKIAEDSVSLIDMQEPESNDDAFPEELMEPRLARAARSMAFLARIFEQVSLGAGISLPQYRLLVFLRHGPKRAGELAARAAIKRPTLTALVHALEKEGRLQRIADELDGRGVRIEMTQKGHRDLKEVESALCSVVNEVCLLGEYEETLDMLDGLAGRLDIEFERRMKESKGRWSGTDVE